MAIKLCYMLALRRLQVLSEVARQGSLAAAAKALSYTPSAISQQIGALEREVGVGLVDRGARGAALTDAGRLLVGYADQILGLLTVAEEELQAMLGLRAGRLRLGAFSTAGAILVPRAVKAFRDRYPDVEVRLIELDPEESLQQLRQREIDLALVYQFPVEELPLSEVQFIPVLDDRLNIALPLGHSFASRKRVKLADLAGESWIQGVYRGSTVSVVPAACRAAGFEPNIVFRSDDHMAVQGSVAAGLGVAVVPQLTVATARSDIVIRPLEVEGDLLTRLISVALPTSPFRAPAVTAMLEIIKRVCDRLAVERPPKTHDPVQAGRQRSRRPSSAVRG
jgi:DNA-binding transcriptional LysR family regulator